MAAVPALLVAGMVLLPFAQMLAMFLDIGYLGELGGQDAIALLTRAAIMNSVVQGTASAVASFLAGLPIGLFLGRYEFRFKRVLRSFAILPFFLPSIVVVTAFIASFGAGSPAQAVYPGSSVFSRGLWGIVAVNTFFNAPLVAMMTMLAVEHEDMTLDEAARTLGASVPRRFVSVWGREGMVAAAGGALLAFLYSFAGFTAPLIIGGPGYFTLEAWIYFMVRTLNNIPFAAIMSLIESAALTLPALAYFLFMAGTRRVSGVGRASSFTEGRRSPFFVAGAVYVAAWIVAEGYILGSVFLSSFEARGGGTGLLNYALLFGGRTTSALGISTASALMNTIFYGLMACIIVTSVGLVWIFGKRRSGSRFYVVTDTMQFMPLIISAVIFSFSISVVFRYGGPFPYDWALIIAAQSVIAIPIVLRVIEAGFASIPASYAEAALTLRGNPFFEIELPLARSTLASALMFGFAISLGEFTATNMLATTSYMPLGVQIYALEGVRLFGPADAAAALLLIISLGSFYIVQRLGEVFVAVR